MNKKSKVNQKKADLPKAEAPSATYSSQESIFDSTELHPILLQLLEKSIKEADEGKTFTHEEVMRMTKEKYPFLK